MTGIPQQRPTISLVIPAYNEEAYLPACLDAVTRNLADRLIDIIVVDNNSTDRTASIIRCYPGVTYVFEPEKGITRARQRGHLVATGDIVAFVDADTRPPPGWVEQIAERFARDNDLVCLSGPYSFYDLGIVRNAISAAWFVAAKMAARFTGHLVVGGNFAIRSSALRDMGGFDRSIEFYGEDVDIGKRARRHGKVIFCPSFTMPTSARRMKKQGFLAMAWLYFVNYLAISRHGKPATMEYQDVR